MLLSGCTLSAALRHDEIRSVWGPGRALPPQMVFFATDRVPDGAGFAQSWGGVAHCGRARVPIANAVSPAAPDPVLEPITCDGPAAMAAFASQVAASAKARNCSKVLLIAQGFNLTFRVALLHGAQVAMDSQWPCAVLAFDWSSEGRFNRYMADVERSGYSVPVMISLLEALQAAGLETEVLAHSLGARIAMAATGAVCSRPRPVVGEMVLVAADVSAEPGNDDFAQLLKRDAPCARRITIYASDNDLALMASRSVHGGVNRAGQSPLADLQYRAPRIDVIDASLAPDDLSGHAYFIFSYEMLTDIMWTLNGASMAERVAKGGLACTDWSGGACAANTGRHVLKVAPERQPGFRRRLLKHIAPIVLPLQ
ncbi:MAG: alpha/beta hydrolase [Alphaproteobacteria bacterium]|nr:alpha/beta hydrolase [Alphaproteobacteria bacterium]